MKRTSGRDSALLYIPCRALPRPSDGSWSFFVACWFWFITFTTIGFGDFGPEDWGKNGSIVFTMVRAKGDGG